MPSWGWGSSLVMWTGPGRSRPHAGTAKDWRSTTSIVTISAIKADVGGFVGHSAVHPDLLSQAQRRVGEAVAERLLIDGAVDSCGDDVDLMHERWEHIDIPAPIPASR